MGSDRSRTKQKSDDLRCVCQQACATPEPDAPAHTAARQIAAALTVQSRAKRDELKEEYAPTLKQVERDMKRTEQSGLPRLWLVFGFRNLMLPLGPRSPSPISGRSRRLLGGVVQRSAPSLAKCEASGRDSRQRVWGQQPVDKGEARNMARNGSVDMADIRPLFNEGKDVFRLDLDHRDVQVSESTPVWLLTLGLAHRWTTDGAEGAATLLAEAEQSAAIESPSDERLWAVAVDLEQRLPSSHKTAKALAGITRSRNQIINMTVRGGRTVGEAVAAKAAQTILELET